MEISNILTAFNTIEGLFPHQAVQAAIEKQTEITPSLLQIIKNIIEDKEPVNLDRFDIIFALHLLSKFRETSAFPYILQLASLPEDRLEELLGDCITQCMPRYIVSTFNGDLSGIKTLIENENACEWSRDAALQSLLGLFAIQKLTREEIILYLKELFISSFAEKIEFTTSLVNVACDLYPEELLEEITNAFAHNKVDEWVINMGFIRDILDRGKEACLKQYVYEYESHFPIDNIKKSMSWMAAFSLNQTKNHKNNYQYIDVRTTPKIGRNNPCYCGSGKKFKKCCLQ